MDGGTVGLSSSAAEGTGAEPSPTVARVVAWSVAELRHLLGCIAWVVPWGARHYRFWSRWRRTHQAIARAFHYRRRLAKRTEVQL